MTTYPSRLHRAQPPGPVRVFSPQPGVKPQALPKGIYPGRSGMNLNVKLAVGGAQLFIGNYSDLDLAVCHRDQALHALTPWLRKLPRDLIPKEDLAGLPSNPRVEAMVSRLRSVAPEAEKEGRVPTELPAGLKMPGEEVGLLRQIVALLEKQNALLTRICPAYDSMP